MIAKFGLDRLILNGETKPFQVRSLGPDALYYGGEKVSPIEHDGFLMADETLDVSSVVWVVSGGKTSASINDLYPPAGSLQDQLRNAWVRIDELETLLREKTKT